MKKILSLVFLSILFAGCASNDVRTNPLDYDPGSMYNQLLQQCDQLEQVEWQCVYPGVTITETDRARCRARAYEAAEWETCAWAAHDEMKCMETYFYQRRADGSWCEETSLHDIGVNLRDVCYVEFWNQEHLVECPTFW